MFCSYRLSVLPCLHVYTVIPMSSTCRHCLYHCTCIIRMSVLTELVWCNFLLVFNIHISFSHNYSFHVCSDCSDSIHTVSIFCLTFLDFVTTIAMYYGMVNVMTRKCLSTLLTFTLFVRSCHQYHQ